MACPCWFLSREWALRSGSTSLRTAKSVRRRATPTLALLQRAARQLSLPITFGRNSPAGLRRCVWPTSTDPQKSAIPSIIRASRAQAVIPCPTVLLNKTSRLAWLPGCVKPNVGTQGRGFRHYHTPAEFEHIRAHAGHKQLVLQPLLCGFEFRATVFADGKFAVARLVDRDGAYALWKDVSTSFPPRVVDALARIVRHLNQCFIGFDLIQAGKKYYLIDINCGPSLYIHLATTPSYDLSHHAARCLAATHTAKPDAIDAVVKPQARFSRSLLARSPRAKKGPKS